MKRIMILAIGLLVATSCSRNDDNDNVSIVGVWKQSKIVTYDGNNNTVISTKEMDDCSKKNTLEFTSSGKVNSKSFTSLGGKCIEDETSSQNYTYDASNKKLTVDGKTDEVDLKGNELRFVIELYDENDDGVKDKVVAVFNR